jgi:hypothetical protein
MLDLNDFPIELQQKIEKILISDEDIIFYGSQNDPMIQAKADIDIMQIIKRKDSRESVMNEIKDLFRNIEKITDGTFYISEIKMGEDEVIRDEIERLLKNRKKIMKKKVIEFLDNITNKNINDINELKSLLNKRMTIENYYSLVDKMRDLYVYRWSAKDVIEGKADFTLKNNELICKYDVQVWNCGFRYIEMSNYIIFPDLIKKKKENDNDFLKSLRKNIIKQYFSDKNIYKTAKRLLTYYKQKGNDKMMEKIYELINNPVLANLYIMKSSLGVLENIFNYNKKKINRDKMKINIESLKMNSIYLDDNDRIKYNRLLDKIYNQLTLKKIEQLKTEINKHLQEETVKYSREINFNLSEIVNSFVEN